MYGKVIKQDGAANVQGYLSAQDVAPGADGLVFAPDGGQFGGGKVSIPERLKNWLVDLRLLRNIPLPYLVPDAALLPAESIRFFHVDPTWVDRVIDGVFAAADTGTVDFVFACGMLASSRNTIDGWLQDLAKSLVSGTGWTPDQPLTGMLIRSDLVRRWPNMIVQAFTGPNMSTAVPVLRAEAISRDIFIAIFAGQPTKVSIQEPFSGVRFGVEPTSQKPAPLNLPYQVDARNPAGQTIPLNNLMFKRVDIPFRDLTMRTLNLPGIAANSKNAGAGSEDSPRQIALNLEQRPYVQEFKLGQDEQLGSTDLPAGDTMKLPRGRSMDLTSLKSRAEQNSKTRSA